MTQLKRLSDGLLVLALVFVVVALFGYTWAWYVAAFCFVDSMVAARLRRRAAKAAKARKASQP